MIMAGTRSFRTNLSWFLALIQGSSMSKGVKVNGGGRYKPFMYQQLFFINFERVYIHRLFT